MISSSSKILLDFHPLKLMCEDMFEREKLLSENGIDSFLPQLRFIENFCHSREDFTEYKRFLIDTSIRDISHDITVIARLNERIIMSEAQAAKTGNSWDKRPTAYERKYFRLLNENDSEWYDIRRHDKKMSKNLWQQEVVRFSAENTRDLADPSKFILHRKKLCKEMLKDKLIEQEFFHDKILSSTRFIFFSKPLSRSLNLNWVTDLSLIEKKIEILPLRVKLVSTGQWEEIEPAGARFDSFFTIVSNTSHKDERPLVSFSFRNFFPILDHYRDFHSLNEMEALINIYAKMYSLIRDELETACKHLEKK